MHYFQPWILISITFFSNLFFMQLCSTVEAEKILSLPGQPPVSFQQFAGYVTIDETQNRSLFYYFVEAEFDPASKPLVLWLNGGPGCSSVGGGAFSENGPFKPSGRILVKNNYSWNKEANMLYLESPAGVGFSYSANASFYAYVNDYITAQDNHIFLQNWFIKYPEYKDRDFFIAGESYAGRYIPQLAQLIVQSHSKFNLKGIALGNPLLEFSTDFNSRGLFYWSHSLISDSTYELVTSTCNISQLIREALSDSLSLPCTSVANLLTKEVPYDFIDLYDVTLDVCLSSSNQSRIKTFNQFIGSRFQYSSSLQQSKLPGDSIQQQVSGNVNVCIVEETTEYLNRKDVQKALNAQLVGVGKWGICSSVLHYDLQDVEIPTIHTVGSLIKSGISVLVYSGDQDSVIPFIGSRILVNELAKELGLNTTVSYRAWLEGKQVGGWNQVYGNVLSFATIRGGSHQAPFSSPERSLAMFTAFLGGKPLPEA